MLVFTWQSPGPLAAIRLCVHVTCATLPGCTACESVGERWCDGAGGLLTLGFRPHRCLHACWRGMVTGPIFDCRETVMGSCTATRARGGAQPARVSGSDGATAQAVCLTWVSGHTDAWMHVGGGVCDPMFDCRETEIGLRNSHLEFLRRTQTVEDPPQMTGTVSEAYW